MRAAEQRDAADEAGANDGASPLISVFDRHLGDALMATE
jgi:hypothetical protein